MHPRGKNLDLTTEVRYSTFLIVVEKKKKFFPCSWFVTYLLTHNWARYQLLVVNFIKDNDHALLSPTGKADLQVSYPNWGKWFSRWSHTSSINIILYFKTIQILRPHFRPARSETLGWGSAVRFNKLLRWFCRPWIRQTNSREPEDIDLISDHTSCVWSLKVSVNSIVKIRGNIKVVLKMK